MTLSPKIIKILKITVKVLTGILFAITFLAGYGGFFNPEHWTLPAILVLFFPYFAMLTLVVSGVWLALKRYVIGGIGIGVLLACGPTFLDAMPFRFGNSPSDPARTFRMVTFNCLHLQDNGSKDPNFNRSLHFLIHSDADFICLQELYSFDHAMRDFPDRYASQLDSLLSIYPYTSGDAGKELEFLSKYPFEYLDVQLPGVNYSSVAAYRLQLKGSELTVVNVHLPSYLLSETERQIITEANSRQGMKNSIRELEGSVYSKLKNAFISRAKVSEAVAEYASALPGNVIICGDFNDVPGSWTYRNFTKRGFVDAYAQTGFGHLITYNLHLMWFHIDQILFRGDLVPLNVKKDRLNASDHYPLIAEFEFL